MPTARRLRQRANRRKKRQEERLPKRSEDYGRRSRHGGGIADLTPYNAVLYTRGESEFEYLK